MQRKSLYIKVGPLKKLQKYLYIMKMIVNMLLKVQFNGDMPKHEILTPTDILDLKHCHNICFQRKSKLCQTLG